MKPEAAAYVKSIRESRGLSKEMVAGYMHARHPEMAYTTYLNNRIRWFEEGWYYKAEDDGLTYDPIRTQFCVFLEALNLEDSETSELVRLLGEPKFSLVADEGLISAAHEKYLRQHPQDPDKQRSMIHDIKRDLLELCTSRIDYNALTESELKDISWRLRCAVERAKRQVPIHSADM